MYNFTLFLHSWSRWLVLILAVIAIFKAMAGWLGKQPFSKQDNILGASFVGSMHLQLLLGLILYFFLSPMGLNTIQTVGMKEVMKSPLYRYWAVEHLTTMLLAVILAQVGRIQSKKASTDLLKHKKAFIFYTIALVLVLSRVPWDRLGRGL
jgi:putative Ca2+/H+ antiporter (TMEM165/GDT1 family)